MRHLAKNRKANVRRDVAVRGRQDCSESAFAKLLNGRLVLGLLARDLFNDHPPQPDFTE